MSHTALLDADRYFAKYGLTPERLALAKPDAIVMHPQPMNRGIEIASDVADGPQSVIRHQVRNGVAMRMAVLEAVMESRRRAAHEPRASRHDLPRRSARPAPDALRRRSVRDSRARARSARRTRSPAVLRTSPAIRPMPMRRPLSLMRVDAEAGWVEMLYKVVGPGLHALAARKEGDIVSLLGPIGRGFTPHRGAPARPADRRRCRNSADGVPCRAAARPQGRAWKPLVLMGSEIPFPFHARPSQIMVAGIPAGAIACMPLLDEWGIASRLASRAGLSRAASTDSSLNLRMPGSPRSGPPSSPR